MRPYSLPLSHQNPPKRDDANFYKSGNSNPHPRSTKYSNCNTHTKIKKIVLVAVSKFVVSLPIEQRKINKKDNITNDRHIYIYILQSTNKQNAKKIYSNYFCALWDARIKSVPPAFPNVDLRDIFKFKTTKKKRRKKLHTTHIKKKKKKKNYN